MRAERELGVMTAKTKLDPNAKLAIGAVIAVILLILLMTVRSLVTAMTPVAVIDQGDKGDAQLIVIGGQSEYFAPSTTAGKVVSWLNGGKSRTHAVSVSDDNFESGSDEIAPSGMIRLGRLVGFLQSDPKVSAKLIETKYEGADAAEKQRLADKRAQTVRAAVIAHGIDPSRIESAPPEPLSKAEPSNEAPPIMVVVLTK
jgi:nucleotide-binding universal stress UspA family protein